MQTFGQQGEDSSSRNIQLKCVGEKLFFQFRKSLDFGSGRHESLAFTIWREISRSLKEFLFMQPSISSFDMVIFPELATGAGLLSGTRTDHFTNRMRHAGPGTVNTLPPLHVPLAFLLHGNHSCQKRVNMWQEKLGTDTCDHVCEARRVCRDNKGVMGT